MNLFIKQRLTEHKLMVNKGGKVERDNYEFGISRYKLCVCVCACMRTHTHTHTHTHTRVAQLDPMDCSLPGSPVHRIFQARILEWLPFPPPGTLYDPGIKPHLLHWQEDSLPLCHPGSLRYKLLLTK